jgi:hypothetical protein
MTDRSKRSAADVLLELLGKVPDAATLELLLEPPHLTQLVREYGVSDTGARTPGELLLEVLARQPDTAVLLASLGNPKPKPAVARNSETRAGAPTTSIAAARAAARLVVGLLLALPAAWYLFVRLDVLHVPGLIRYFPGAYALLAALLVTGIYLTIVGIAGLRR